MKRSIAAVLAVLFFDLMPADAPAAVIGQDPATNPAISTMPASAADTVRRGFEALARGDMASAERSFNEGLAGDKKLAAAYIGLAEVAIKRGKPDDAQQALERGLKANPDDSGLVAAQGRLAASQGKLPEAVALLKCAVARSRTTPPHWQIWATCNWAA